MVNILALTTVPSADSRHGSTVLFHFPSSCHSCTPVKPDLQTLETDRAVDTTFATMRSVYGTDPIRQYINSEPVAPLHMNGVIPIGYLNE